MTVHDSAAMDWLAVPNAGPMPGLFVKYLHIDPISGFYTRLVYAQEGWADHRLAHHPCYEEAYTTEGKMSYNFGDLDPGTYFFRPARVKHGHFVAMEGGTTWLMRSDGELENWYTQNEWVRWGGDAVNYSPEGGANDVVLLLARHGRRAELALRRGPPRPAHRAELPEGARCSGQRLRAARHGPRPQPGGDGEGLRLGAPRPRPRRARARPRPRPRPRGRRWGAQPHARRARLARAEHAGAA
ncbi:DUF4437 domain-containing protein [Yinghuangia aomiensis]